VTEPVSQGQVRVPVRRVGQDAAGSGRAHPVEDWVAVEEPLEIRLAHGPDGQRQAVTLCVTMRTPGDDENLVAGLLLTEGIVGAAADIRALAAGGPRGDGPNVLVADLRPGLAVALDGLERHLYTGSACGVCGKTSIEAVRTGSAFAVGTGFRVAAATLATLPAALLRRQAVFQGTGGLQGAALFDAAGDLRDVREDVGRHNAVDKIMGAALRRGDVPLAGLGLLVSGRASFEILQKARMAGCPLVVAVGAPSSLAIALAWDAGMTLVGFLRDGRFNVYTCPDRIADRA
jgi:FdhD protein